MKFILTLISLLLLYSTLLAQKPSRAVKEVRPTKNMTLVTDTTSLPASCAGIVNCSFDDEGASWQNWGAPTTREYREFQNATTLHVVSSGAVQGVYQVSSDAVAGGTATVYYRVWVTTSRVRIIARNNTSGFTGNNVQVTTTGQWVEGTLSITWPDPLTEARIFAESTGGGQEFDVDYLYIIND